MSVPIATPVKVGVCNLQNRVVMAPLTRFRADADHVPLDFVKEYYAQRASVPGTLLITEATFISAEAGGYDNIPGIWSDAQVAAWKEITDAVHANKCYIFMQLWALGRAGGKAVLERDGHKLVSASDIPMDVDLAGNPGEVPTPLSEEDIQRYLRNYEAAAKNAVRAGFDGVEIHGANGYLIDQFTQDVSNRRTDQWGGSVENRARFGLEVAKTITKAIGADRVGYRVSPWGTFQGMGMKDPKPQFTYLVENLAALKLAYVHGVESRTNGPADAAVQDPGKNLEFLIDAIKSKNPDTAFISAGGHTAATANETVEARKDIKMLTACGRYYISNPDLPFRWIHNLPLVKYDRNTFYAAGQKNGYIDYAYSEQYLQAKEKGSL